MPCYIGEVVITQMNNCNYTYNYIPILYSIVKIVSFTLRRYNSLIFQCQKLRKTQQKIVHVFKNKCSPLCKAARDS